jgi:hypothetical protein
VTNGNFQSSQDRFNLITKSNPMQHTLFVLSPSICQMLSMALCGFVFLRLHHKMQVEGNDVLYKNFIPVTISCTTIQIVFKVLSTTTVNMMLMNAFVFYNSVM